MKTIILTTLMILGAQTVFADGFHCYVPKENLNITIYNKVQPTEGTRSAGVMILSDSSVQEGRKTIATFKAVDSLLTNESSTYTALVDLRFKNSSRKGEKFLGTVLGAIKYVVVDVDFTYSSPVKNKKKLSGEVVLVKRNGKELFYDLTCKRYLKN